MQCRKRLDKHSRPVRTVDPCPEQACEVSIFAGHSVLFLLGQLQRIIGSTTTHEVEHLDPKEGVGNFLSSQSIEADWLMISLATRHYDVDGKIALATYL